MSGLTEQIIEALREKAIPEKAVLLSKYFKTGKGEYAEGDKFLGVSVPEQRKIAQMVFKDCSLSDLSKLMKSGFHEPRLTALFILVYKYQKLKLEEHQKELVDFYLDLLEGINNWDLVDSSCHRILGHYFFKKDKSLFYEFAESGQLWKQRIAMISSAYWISKGEYKDALSLAEILLNHPHDLMHKAVGWMLREIGNRNFEVEIEFLKKHYHAMPRTALRYAIEKFPEELRQDFLKGRV